MHQRNDGSKRQIFVDKKAAQQPIKLTNLTLTPSGTIFFNKGASVQDVPNHVIKFQFVPQQPFQITKISFLLKSTSGPHSIQQDRPNGSRWHPYRQLRLSANFSLGGMHYFDRRNKILQHNRLQTPPLLWKMLAHDTHDRDIAS